MSRAATLVLALAVLLVASVAAKAAPPQRTGQSPSDVARYWTEDRMRDAVPREHGRAGEPQPAAGKPPKGGAAWTATAVPLPYTGTDLTNGKVFFTENGVNYVCSGTSVQTSSGSLVWTAGHCVNEGPGAYVTNFMFAPGWVDGTAPYGRWAATQPATTDQWRTAGDFTYDVGVARVAPGAGAPPSGTLADIATPRSMTFNYPVVVGSTSVTSYGYPASGKFNGQRLRTCTSPVVRRDGSASDAPMAMGCDMNGGASGGAWIVSGGVGSVNSYIYNGLKNTMFGPYQGAIAQALYAGMG